MLDNFLRILPDFKGKRRLTKMIFKNKIEHARDIVIQGRLDCQYLLPNLIETVAQEIFVNGGYEPESIQFISENLPQNGVFIDIGCNIGAISIPLAKKRKDLKIYSIEGSQRVFDYFVKNIALNKLTNITPIKAALSDKDGMEMTFYSPDVKFGKGSFSKNFVSNSEPLKTSTLSSLVKQYNISQIDFVKIDVEGYESKVFAGGLDDIVNHSPIILFEFADWAEATAIDCKTGDAQELLRSLNYKLYDFDHPGKPLEGIKKQSGMILAKK